MTEVCFWACADGERIAYRRTKEKCAGTAQSGRPGVVWVGGFRSDMEGTKAQFVSDWAARHGLDMLRYDYFGHGRSSGDFLEGTISRWRDDTLTVFDHLSEGKQIVLGSSMGGWMSNLLMRARPERIAGVIWLAPAPDFTEDLMWDEMSEDARRAVMETGQWVFTEDGDSFPITRALIESGRENLVLDTPLSVDYPIRILHGLKDMSVPWMRSLKLLEGIEGDIRLTYLKNSDHRLSSPEDLKLLEQTLDAMLADILAKEQETA